MSWVVVGSPVAPPTGEVATDFVGYPMGRGLLPNAYSVPSGCQGPTGSTRGLSPKATSLSWTTSERALSFDASIHSSVSGGMGRLAGARHRFGGRGAGGTTGHPVDDGLVAQPASQPENSPVTATAG